MTLTILDPQRLRLVDQMSATPAVPTVEMAAYGGRYLTVVIAHLGRRHPQRFCLYSEQHPTPQVPEDVTAAVAAFAADPAGEWARLVAEALDTEEQMVTEDLGARLTRIAETRRRLLP